MGLRTIKMTDQDNRTRLERRTEEGKGPVGEIVRGMDGTRVAPDT